MISFNRVLIFPLQFIDSPRWMVEMMNTFILHSILKGERTSLWNYSHRKEFLVGREGYSKWHTVICQDMRINGIAKQTVLRHSANNSDCEKTS